MLSKVLKKSTCADCRFCCSFRRCSLWETPLFPKETMEKLEKEYGIKVDKKKIELKEAIKILGTTNVQIKLNEGVIGTVKIDVLGE